MLIKKKCIWIEKTRLLFNSQNCSILCEHRSTNDATQPGGHLKETPATRPGHGPLNKPVALDCVTVVRLGPALLAQRSVPEM